MVDRNNAQKVETNSSKICFLTLCFHSLHNLGKAHVTFRMTLMSKFRHGTVAFKSILFLPHSPPIEVELHGNDLTYFGQVHYLYPTFLKTKTYGRFLCFSFRCKRENLARTKANSVKKNFAWTLFRSYANWHRIFSIIIYLTRDTKF